jgi:hypothetical protein
MRQIHSLTSGRGKICPQIPELGCSPRFFGQADLLCLLGRAVNIFSNFLFALSYHSQCCESRMIIASVRYLFKRKITYHLPCMSQYQNIETTVLLDMLARHTQQLTTFFTQRTFDREYEHCKNIILDLQSEIDFRLKQADIVRTVTNNNIQFDTGEPSI